MGNVVDSMVSGFTKVLADVLATRPLDFLSGKACSTACGSTWDVVCYVDNFCVASLAKTAAMLFLLYLVLVFFYLVYKLGICGCVCHGLCAILCSCSSACKHGCAHLCNKMRSIKRERRRRPTRHPRHDDVEQGHFHSSSTDSEQEDAITRHRSSTDSEQEDAITRHRSSTDSEQEDAITRHRSSTDSEQEDAITRHRSSTDSEQEDAITRHRSSTDSEQEDAITRHRHAAARHGGSETSSLSRRRVYLERSLRPRNHRVTVGVSRRSDVIIDGKEPRVNHRHDGSERPSSRHQGDPHLTVCVQGQWQDKSRP